LMPSDSSTSFSSPAMAVSAHKADIAQRRWIQHEICFGWNFVCNEFTITDTIDRNFAFYKPCHSWISRSEFDKCEKWLLNWFESQKSFELMSFARMTTLVFVPENT
jgi:hypothetical protein